MMRVLARDVIGVDGWAPWLFAADDPQLPLLWPRLLATLLEMDASYAPFDGDGRLDIVQVRG